MHKLCKYIDRELEELEEKVEREGKLSRTDIEDGKNLAKFKMALLTNKTMEDEAEESRGYSGRRYRDGMSGRRYRDDYADDYSGEYSGEGASGRRYHYTQRDDGASGRRRRDSMGRYADSGYSGDAYSGRYSRAEAKDKLIGEMEGMMGDVSPEAKHAIQKAIHALDQE